MNIGSSALLLFSLFLPVDGAFLRNATSHDTSLYVPLTRNLQVDGMKDFKSLTCNSALASAQCVSWTKKFGTAAVQSARVIIPCGECVTMDLAGGSLALQAGIDIIGKLVFPDGYKLDLSSTVIAIQGELEMTATKTVDGIPNIKFTMIGNNDQFFTPVDVNAKACKGADTCLVGKKGIVVAGGKVNIHGLPGNTPSWTKLSAIDGPSNNPDTIVVPNSVIGKWGVGAQILITPHTRVWNDNQVRTIKSVIQSGTFALLKLDSPILRPTTVSESKDFAVEIALLSRNIVFEGGTDTNSQHGGHFMIMHTPEITQTIEGVDFKNFGQQGNLGRYPIHFHFCNDSPGSVVSKNTIRQSNQRCVVVHGTNHLRIEENVAFDTKGHCYITEDGIETNNQFIRNLGAQTGIPDTIIPNDGTNGDETDGQPATFWITNPTNSWIGNVAAGSEHSGYWFEPKLRGARASAFPGFDPMFSPLVMFKDNVAHSNNAGSLGAIRMYTPGYFPPTMTPFTGLKVYRNNANGFFIHRCQNMRVENSLFADNNVAIDLDRAEGIEVTNTVIIGQSPSYEALMARQPGVAPVCQRGVRTGFDLHTWQKEIGFLGAKVSNISMSGFSPNDPNCAKPSSMRFESFNLKQGLFEFYTGFSGMQLADGVNSINMCIINEVEFDFLYLIDLDGSFRPNKSVPPAISSLVASDNKEHMKFVNAASCSENAVGCYSYCYNTCFRSMRYYVEGPDQANYKLKVCRRNDHSRCTLFKGGRRGDTGPHEFTAHLPSGDRYDAVFLDSTGREITPVSVTEVVELTFCPQGIFEVTRFGTLSITSSGTGAVPSPIRAPISAPVSVPIRAPAVAPLPVRAPASAPVTAPVRAPVKVPIRAPTTAPKKAMKVRV